MHLHGAENTHFSISGQGNSYLHSRNTEYTLITVQLMRVRPYQLRHSRIANFRGAGYMAAEEKGKDDDAFLVRV